MKLLLSLNNNFGGKNKKNYFLILLTELNKV